MAIAEESKLKTKKKDEQIFYCRIYTFDWFFLQSLKIRRKTNYYNGGEKSHTQQKYKKSFVFALALEK